MTEAQSRRSIDRRHVLAGGLGAAGLVGLAACGDGASGSGGDSMYGDGGAPAATPSSTSPGPSSAAASPSTPAAGAAGLVALADVPVGGAVSATSADGKPLIVAQPTAGTAVAFSAICTHQGCTVAPASSQLRCPCHGSVFAIADGARVSGPAPAPLAPVAVEVVDGQVVPA